MQGGGAMPRASSPCHIGADPKRRHAVSDPVLPRSPRQQDKRPGCVSGKGISHRHRTTKAAFARRIQNFPIPPPGRETDALQRQSPTARNKVRERMGGWAATAPDRHAASIKASSIPPQAAEPCPIHDLRAVTAGRASACAKTLSSNTASLRSLRGVPVPCAETQSTAWGSRPASASAPRTACSAKRADSSGAVSAPPSREAPNPRSSANTAAPRARADSKDSKHECGSTLAGNKTVTGLVKGSGRFRWHGVPAERVGFGIPEHPAAGKAGIPA